MRRQFSILKTICLFLIVVLLVTSIPANVYAEGPKYYYAFFVQTADEPDAGTDDWVYAGVTFVNGHKISEVCDASGNDHQRGQGRHYEFTTETRIPSPWLLKTIFVKHEDHLIPDDWKCHYVDAYLPLSAESPPKYVATAVFDCWTRGKGEIHVDVSSQAKRRISSFGSYDNWGGTFYLDKNSQSTTSNSWNGYISDQYATYNPVNYDDAPTFDYTLSHTQITQAERNQFITFNSLSGSGASITIKQKELYNIMSSRNIGILTLTVRLGFHNRSTSNYYGNMVGEGSYYYRNKAYTFYRCVFDLGNASISQTQTFQARTGYNYLNRTYRNVKITISPTSIYCGAITEQQKKDIVNNFNCTAALYLGNDTSKKLCDMTMKKDNGTLIFEGTIPMDVQGGPNEGLRLQLNNISSTIGGKTYVLQDGTDSKYFYFSDYKVDTKYPTIRLTDSNGTDVSIQDSIRSEHNFYFVSSETLYPEKNVTHTPENERYLRYELYQKTGEGYGSSPVPITGYMGSGSQTQVQAPVSTSVIQDAMIRLKTANPIEGQFKLRIYGYDDGNNGLFGNDYYEIENVYLDRKAPRVQVTEIVQNQAPDGTKRNDYTFEIDDLQKGRQFGSWTRTYYCFVEEGQQLPDPASQSIEPVTGEIDVITGKWAFVEGGTETTTEVLRVPRGETFKGKLYYYTLDSCGNDSRSEQNGYFTKDIVIHNYDAKDTLITEPYTYPKSNYNISFDLSDENYRTEYRWIAKDNSFTQDYRVYTGAENVGAGVQIDKDGQEHVFDGVYTLQYKVTEIRSGNWRTFEKDYVFDNKGPVIKANWLTNNSLLLPTQQLKVDIDDVSGLTEAEYQIVNPDGSAIEGYEKTPINITTSADNRGIVNETLTFQLPENGIYALKITAKDSNGIESTLENVTFGIRNEKPEITSISHDLDVLVDGCGATADGNYSLTLKVADRVKNVANLETGQDVRYCISANGTDYGEWITAENAVKNVKTDSIEYVVTLTKPFELAEGWNTLYIKTACVNEGAVDDPRSSVVSEPITIKLLYDKKAPEFDDPIYSTIDWTKEDVVVEIKAYDAGTGVCTLTGQNEEIEISGYQDGKFTVIVKQNVRADLVLSDSLGNQTLVPIAVNNIDKSVPVAVAVSENFQTMARMDGKVEITVTDQTDVQTVFALVKNPSEGYTLTKADYTAFTQAKGVTVEEGEAYDSDGMRVKKYIVYLRGLDGVYGVGIKSTDVVGNTAEILFTDQALTLVDAQPAIVRQTCNPPITKSTTTVTLEFNVPVVVLPNAPSSTLMFMSDTGEGELFSPAILEADENYVTEYSLVCSSPDPVTIYVMDECKRTAALTFIPDALFVEGFEISARVEKNGAVIENGGFISFLPEDTIYYIVEPSEKYQGQYFFIDEAEYSGMRFNEQGSIVDETYQDEQGGTAYKKLCFEALHDGKTAKSVRFKSYTLEGNEEDRLQDEYLVISVVDETPPVGTVSYSETKLTNQNVYATITMSDSESGIAKLEKSYDGGITYTDTGAIAQYIEEFEENGTVYFRITNGAGMTTIITATVSNIDKMEITEGVHYTVEYSYENYLGEWVPIVEGKAYRRVMATLKPIPGSGKTLTATNNGGSFTRILTKDSDNFTFSFRDEAGNVGSKYVEYTMYDNEPGTTTWVLSNYEKTNQNIFAFITVTDDWGDIAFVEVKKDGIVYPVTGPVENEYVVELDSSGSYHVTAYDFAGNSWTEIITVSNINKVPPKVLAKVYSTPLGTITAKSVRVELTEFNKDISTITMTGIEIISGVTSRDIVYTPGEKAIRFKKNGSVAMKFVDDYGNEGVEIVTVSNICTNPPAVEAVATLAEDRLSVTVTFDKMLDEDGVPVDPYRELSDLMVTFGGITYKLPEASFTLKNNGDYEFYVHDSSGATQKIMLSVTGIDDKAPVIREVRWEYKYREENENGIWEEKLHSRTIEIGKDTSGKESGYMVAPDESNPETNQNVTVTVTTDKETMFIGGKDSYSLQKSMEYRENGLFVFNLQARNGTSASYGVGIGVIDKTPPVITLDNGPELIFIEGMTKDRDPMYAYDKSKLMDFHAYDIKDGKMIDLTDKVKINFNVQGRVFDPDNINNNEFVRSNPYYVEYTVYDAAGNGTTVRRTIRLVGFYDTIAPVNGKMPDMTNVASVKGDKIEITLKNFSGISYARYEQGIYTQGQMKTRGTPLTERNGVYTIENASEGWYTIYIQTDKRDYFNIYVYVVPETEN